MRDLRVLNAIRDCSAAVVEHYGSVGDHEAGVFNVASPIDGATLRVIASVGFGWEHISISRRNRCPNWPEMEHVKRLFFREDETAIQFHVPASEHVNDHPNCLHLWRPKNGDIVKPPKWMVGRYKGWEADFERDTGEVA